MQSTNIIRKLLKVAVLLLALTLVVMSVSIVSAQTDDPATNALIAVVIETETFSDWLPNYPNYQVNASGPDENGNWYIEFFNESWDEWLGYASINGETQEIIESFAPKPLDADVYQHQIKVLNRHVLADAEVLGWLNNVPDLWEQYTDFNRWEQVWEISFYRGIEGVYIRAYVDENDNVYIDLIADPNQLDEQKAQDNARNEAINLAYSAAGIDAALEGYDNWTTYAEWQREEVWSVSFVVEDRVLFFALVDLSDDDIIETVVGYE